jgi:hypothetical protein
MMSTNIRVPGSLFFLLCFNYAFAQTEFSVYRLHNTLPQSNMLNPAFAPGFKLVIGLPVISSVRIGADLDGITFVDVFNSSGRESLILDTALISARMKDVNHVRINQATQLFYLGMTLGKSYVSVGLHEVSDFMLNYPGDLVGWAIRGPGHSQYVGRPLELGSLYGKAFAYQKMSISVGRNFGNRLRLGARFNYIHGLSMAETAKVSGRLIVGIDSVTVQTGAMQVNTAGFDFFTRGDRKTGDYVNYFFNNRNTGTAWDFGATYKITNRLSLSAAANDIGFITWKDYTRTYKHSPVTYTYRGIDFVDYRKDPTEVNVDKEIDSLRSLFKPTEATGGKYLTRLTGRVYTGIDFKVRRADNLSALFQFTLLQHKRNPALSLGYTAQLGKNLSASLGVTLQQRKIDNIGAGLVLRISNFQIFAASDRAQSIVYPGRATRGDLHTGMNLVFGSLKEELAANAAQENLKEKKILAAKKQRLIAARAKMYKRNVPKRNSKAAAIPSVGTHPEVKEPSSTANKLPMTDKSAGKRRHKITKDLSRDELSHIVVVGTFHSREKADLYSRELRELGFANKLGHNSESSKYYVYVYRSRDIEDAKHMRDSYRKNGDFKFNGTWILTVGDSKFE